MKRKQVQIVLSEEERKKLEKYALARGISLGSFVRMASLDYLKRTGDTDVEV